MDGFYACVVYAAAVLWNLMLVNDLVEQIRAARKKRKPGRGGGRGRRA